MALIKEADEALGKDLLQRGEKNTYKRSAITYSEECIHSKPCTQCRGPYQGCCPFYENECSNNYECDLLVNEFVCLPPDDY